MNTGNIYLIGMMGSGKSTVGKLLAEKMQMIFIDLDEIIETSAQKTVRDIFEQDGELHFRKLESEALVNVNQENSVISCGGGIILDKSNRIQLKSSGKVVFLKASVSELTHRLQSVVDRPLLYGKHNDEELNCLWSERKEFYEETAHITINVDKQTPEQITELIINSLNR
jgi:shikimate kinase